MKNEDDIYVILYILDVVNLYILDVVNLCIVSQIVLPVYDYQIHKEKWVCVHCTIDYLYDELESGSVLWSTLYTGSETTVHTLYCLFPYIHMIPCYYKLLPYFAKSLNKPL